LTAAETVLSEARRRAAAALLAYCEASTEENRRAFLDSVHNLEAAALVVRAAPSQQTRATELRRRTAATR